jgi:hypothetical protein
MKWTESDIQALKAQEAKDLAVKLLRQLQGKDRAPITAGQVQLKELQYGLKIKEAEAEDNRSREAHEQRIKELELQIEQERRKQAEAEQNTDRVRREHAQLMEQVQDAKEALSIQLETATREHAVKMETLAAEYERQNAALADERIGLEAEKVALIETIQRLTGLSEIAQDVEQLRTEIESRKTNQQRELAQLDDAFEQAEFAKHKQIGQLKRDQEIAIAELETRHKKQVMQLDTEAARTILAAVDMLAVSKAEWDDLQQQLQQQGQQDEATLESFRRQCEDDVKRSYNITSAEVFDVTELYYRHKSLVQEASAMREQLSKLEAEITRMRQHIEQEPVRIAKAVEAAKVHIQNKIEQGGRS